MKQQNGTIFVEGVQCAWDEACLPLMSDAVLRSASVFDGLIATAQTSTPTQAILSGQEHISRLRRGCQAMDLEWRWDPEKVLQWCHEVARIESMSASGRNVYVRPMVVGADLLDKGASSTITIAGFVQPENRPATARVQVSSWRRPRSDSMPSSVKSVANYQISRLARLQAQSAGFDDALLLNSDGRIAEGAGAALIMERNGALFSPPAWEGCLPSITLGIIERIAGAQGLTIKREPVTLADVYSADGLAFVGTLADVVDITEVDGRTVPPSAVFSSLRKTYLDASRDRSHAFHGLLRPSYAVTP